MHELLWTALWTFGMMGMAAAPLILLILLAVGVRTLVDRRDERPR